MFILKVKWNNEVTEFIRSDVSPADFIADVPGVLEVVEIGYAIGRDSYKTTHAR